MLKSESGVVFKTVFAGIIIFEFVVFKTGISGVFEDTIVRGINMPLKISWSKTTDYFSDGRLNFRMTSHLAGRTIALSKGLS